MIADVLINGEPIQNYGAMALLDYSIGETPIECETFLGKNRTTERLVDIQFLAREIELGLVFYGQTLRLAKLQRSKFNALLFGGFTIYIPDDGFYYRCFPVSLGEEKLVGIGDDSAAVEARVRCKGFRCDAEEIHVLTDGTPLYCQSTMPRTDCILTVISSHTTNNYHLGGAVFSNVSAGDILLFDGVNGLIKRNGQDCAEDVTWTYFPFLVPGENAISAFDASSQSTVNDTVTVTYSPTYI